MYQTSETINPDDAPVESASILTFKRPYVKAEVSEGFDRIAGRLTDTLNKPPVSLPERERQIIGVVIAKTYRYHKKWDWISREQFSEETGIPDLSNIAKIIKSLIAKKVLIKDGKKIAINTIVSEWQSIPRVVRNPKKVTSDPLKVTSNPPDKKLPTTAEKLPVTPKKLPATAMVVTGNPHNRKTTIQKTILQKTIESLTLPDFLSQTSWNEFIQHRTEVKKPLTELAATKFIKKLSREHSEGHNVTDLIDACIASGWQTTYPPKQNAFTKNRVKPENFANKDYGKSTFTGGQ